MYVLDVWTRFTNVITDKGKPETRVAFVVEGVPKYAFWKYENDGQEGWIKIDYVSP